MRSRGPVKKEDSTAEENGSAHAYSDGDSYQKSRAVRVRHETRDASLYQRLPSSSDVRRCVDAMVFTVQIVLFL